MNTFILMVIFHVNGGSVVSMQEFNSKETCLVAADLIIKEDLAGFKYINCLLK